jgi:hypothetical protein
LLLSAHRDERARIAKALDLKRMGGAHTR